MKIKNKLQKVNFKTRKLYMVWLLGGIFMVVTIYFTIQGAAIGAELSNLEKDEALQVDRNRMLVLEVINSTSLSKTGEASDKLGFSEPTNTLYITGIDTVAQLP